MRFRSSGKEVSIERDLQPGQLPLHVRGRAVAPIWLVAEALVKYGTIGREGDVPNEIR